MIVVPYEVDESSLVPLERGTAPTLLCGCSLYDSIEVFYILCGSCTYNLYSVVIDKSNCTAVLVDILLDEVRIKEKKQDG